MFNLVSVIILGILCSCSTQIPKKEKGIFEIYLDENRHPDNYLESNKVEKNNFTVSCQNLKWDTGISVIRDQLTQKLKKFKVNYDSLYQSYLLAFLNCPKSTFHLNVFESFVLKLRIHQMKTKHKWKFPFTKSELLQSYKKSLAYEYWISVNTLEYMYKENKLDEMNFMMKNIKDVIPKDKFDNKQFILNLKLTNQVIKESLLMEWNLLNDIEKNRVVDFKIKKENLPPHLAHYCSSNKEMEIMESKSNKKLISDEVLENIYGEKYYQFLHPTFCKELNLKNLKEFNETLSQIFP